MALASSHKVWLASHPDRNEGWLRDRIAEGFDVHHLDGDHSNDDPSNLALIEATDHNTKVHALPFTRLKAAEALRERSKRIRSAFATRGLEYGSFVSKIVKGKKYWYWQDHDRKQHYIGPDFLYMQIIVESYNEEKAAVLKEVA
jgi:hypothetical protein